MPAVLLVHHALIGVVGIQEVSEVPLMTAVFLGMVWQVNRRQQAMGELHRIAESQQLFVRAGSHELRNSITVARGYAELIRAARPDGQTGEDTAILVEELVKLDVLTARLATLVTLEHQPTLSRIDLDAVLDKTVRRWSAVAERGWLSTGTAGVVLGDPDRLEAMLDSLIENAVKFTAIGDRIELSARKAGDSVVLEVIDTGEGIPETDLPHIFDWFRSGSTAGERAGSGLGLAIARAAAEARGGTLTVDSRLGYGTTFTASIPASPPSLGQA